MRFLILLLLPFLSCANAISTRFVFKDINGSTLTVEMPKEVEAKNLIVELNAKQGRATIKADWIQSLNVDTIKAQAGRESALTESFSKGVAEGVIEGAKKSIIPIP